MHHPRPAPRIRRWRMRPRLPASSAMTSPLDQVRCRTVLEPGEHMAVAIEAGIGSGDKTRSRARDSLRSRPNAAYGREVHFGLFLPGRHPGTWRRATARRIHVERVGAVRRAAVRRLAPLALDRPARGAAGRAELRRRVVTLHAKAGCERTGSCFLWIKRVPQRKAEAVKGAGKPYPQWRTALNSSDRAEAGVEDRRVEAAVVVGGATRRRQRSRAGASSCRKATRRSAACPTSRPPSSLPAASTRSHGGRFPSFTSDSVKSRAEPS